MPQRNWLITGVSSGFGRIMTEQLLPRGDRIAGTVRDLSVIDDLKAEHGDRLWQTELDLFRDRVDPGSGRSRLGRDQDDLLVDPRFPDYATDRTDREVVISSGRPTGTAATLADDTTRARSVARPALRGAGGRGTGAAAARRGLTEGQPWPSTRVRQGLYISLTRVPI